MLIFSVFLSEFETLVEYKVEPHDNQLYIEAGEAELLRVLRSVPASMQRRIVVLGSLLRSPEVQSSIVAFDA